MYQLFIKNTQNGDIIELPFMSLNFTEELNRGKDATFVLDYDMVADIADTYNTDPIFILAGGFREIWVEKDEIKIYYGVVWDLGLNEEDKTETVSITVSSVGFFDYLYKRRTGVKRVFTGVDAGSIAWTLIDENQQSDLPYSDLGITQGSIAASVHRDRILRFARIKDEIIQLSNTDLENGFDFEIDNEKKFNVYYPQKGSNRVNIIIDDINGFGWRYRLPLISSLCNKVDIVGSGINDDVLYVTKESSIDYKTSFGLLEEMIADRAIITSDTLNDKGGRYLLDNQSPRPVLEINHVDGDPDIMDYEVGDSLKVQLNKLNIDNYDKRVMSRRVSIDANQMAIVTVSLQ